MATHTNANTFSTKLHRNVLTMPKWVTETHDRVGPKPPPPPSPTTPDSGVKLPVLPPKSKNLPEPDYEVIEFSGQQYSNEVLKAGSRSKTPSTPDAKLKCTLCGSHNPWVTCEECAQQIFCASCDDMFHKHPKRRAHVRKAVEQTRPPLPPKILPGQNGPTPPVAPPRRKGRGFATPLLQRKEQVDMNTLPIPPSPTPSLRSTSWQDRVSSLKSGLNLMNRPLPDTPKTPTSEHTSSRSVTPKSVFDSIQRPPSVTLEKIKSKASATLDRMTLLQQRYRQHKADSQRSNNDCSGSVTDQNLSFDQWSNISPSPSHFRSGSMSSGINSSHFDLTDDTHFHNMFNQRQMHPSTAQQQRANGQLGTRGMSTSVFNLSHINRRAPEPQNTWMNNPMQQAQSMAHLNCATCASPQTNAWHAHTQRHMPMANVQTDGWGNQFPSQQQLNRSNLSLNVGAGYMMPHHHGASGMMAPPPVFMNQTGMMTGMYPYPYHGGMPVMNPGLMGMPPPTRSRATSRAGSRAASPAMSRKSMPVRRKQRTTSYVEDELTDDEDSDQDDRRSIISNRSGMTNTLRTRQRRISSASQLLDDESETNQRQARGKLRDARDRRGSIAKSVQSDWLPSRRPTVNHSSSSNRQNEPGFVNTNKPTRIYSDLDSESSGTRALVQAKIQEKLEKSTKRSSSKEKMAEAARQKPNKVSTEVQAGGSRTIVKSTSATAVKAEENQTPIKQNTDKYETVQIKANKKEASEDDEEEEEEELEESGSEETESEQEEEEQAAEVSTQLEEGNASQAVDAGEANEDNLGPPPSTPDHEWECEFCTYVNEPNIKICLICCKTPSHGARKTSTTTAPTPSVSEEQPAKVSAATSLSSERASVDKEKRTSSTERTKDKPKDKVKEKPKDKVTSTSTSTSTGTTDMPKRKIGVAQSIISNLTNGMSKLKITSSEHDSGATTLTKKKESVEDVWAALDDNIQTTANEIMRKAEKSKKSTKVSTSCGTSPIREVTKAKDAQKLQRSVKETGTSPPPQSISTQTYDTLPLRQPEPSVAETVATGGGIFYSENSQLHRDAHSPLSILPPDMPHYEPRHKEPETELYILLKEAELYKFTPEELHAALKYCGTSTHPIQWLRENWHKLIQTVQSLSTKYGQERAENIIGTISQIEAREALRQHGGNIWQAVSECIEQRQRKYRDISSKGNFSREDIVTALTIHQGNADLALLDLGRTQLKPFLMRIRGSPAGVENESGAIFPPATPTEHTIQPESEAMEIEVENQTPELPVETVLSNDKRAEIKVKTSGNESQIDAAIRNEQVQEESSERQSSDYQEVYQHADTQAIATQSNVGPTVVEKTIDTKNQNSLSRNENEHAISAAEPKTTLSSKSGAVSKIPQIRTDASEASTSNSLRSTMSTTRNNKVGLQKSAIPSAKSMAEQAKPKDSKIPKQTAKKVPLRSKSFSGPPGPIGISSVKTIQQEFLKRQNQLTTRYEPPKNPPTIVRKKSIAEAITKYMPSTSASASGSKTIAAASIFRTHARIPKKKYHETCFSDDDYETTASEEEPEPLEIRQRKQSVPVFRAYPSVQELEVVPTEVLVRKFVDEKLVASVAEAQIAATLVNMRFQQDVSIWAAKECSDLDQAISMLQQDCELCMGIYPMNQIVSMLKCTHKCCKQCAKTYFTVQITDRSINDCTCPFCKLPELHGHNEHEDENLEYFSNLDIFLKNILDAEVHELFQRKLRDRTLLQDPNFKWCIQCSSGFFARPKQKRLICPDCGSVTCAQCRKAWEKQHEGISCEQFKEWKEANDPEVQAQGVQEHLAQNGIDCPKCKFRYSLARGGCMHFTCTQCKYEFCYGCGKPFMMGAKCTISSYCAKLGLHAHHPRNCLFYLRDKLPIQLQMLLKQNKIPYDEDPIELPNADSEDASTSTPKSARCPIALQKETPTGLVDTVCNGEVPDKHAGLCRTHYVEYLTAKVAKARIDPLPIFDLTDCVQELRRRDIRLPERGPWDTDEIYKGMCSEVIKNNIPLETM
ncbi:E3 ubiquitin-protein ligase lubel isoform X5 [Anastrepha obliqua]|uniref:E3 ubiquitin-protein ligase lubel isoform X5 n=1 Tax=Anastrepha obliqua TaxID=95512 RepID=UPI00240A3B54|nr:E3 ubiquitin-protein ligase lubel isoform X5 [Anastrepha obliqua]